MVSLRPKNIYETPRDPKLEDCEFYHSIELPNGESHDGDWDVRPVFMDYTCGIDFAGKSVLDIGTATGFLSFEAEREGAARIVSLDLPTGTQIAPIPWAENAAKVAEIQAMVDARLERIKNGYWYCRNAFHSNTNVIYRSVYHTDESVGQFDVAIVGCVLLHLCNPFGALAKIALRAKTLIVAELDPGDGGNPILFPNIMAGHRDPTDLFSWWQFPPAVLERFLDVIGFKTEAVNRMQIHSPKMGHTAKFYSLLATRR